MDFLNSQYLTYQDGYIHVFRRPGTFTYRFLILPQGSSGSRGDSTYTIEVTDRGRPSEKGTQHDVVMRWDGKGRTYYPEPARLAIEVNDFVLWRVESQEAAIPPYSILGESKGEDVFDSRALDQHDVFTHLFMVPGRYRLYINHEPVGQIDVRDHREMEPEAYNKQLQIAILVRVLDGKIDPSYVDIAAGQTVVWLVEEGNKIVIWAEADTNETGEPKKTS